MVCSLFDFELWEKFHDNTNGGREQISWALPATIYCLLFEMSFASATFAVVINEKISTHLLAVIQQIHFVT